MKGAPRAALVAIGIFAATLGIVSTAFGVTEDFKTFFAALTAASTPLGSGDKLVVLQGGTDKYIPGNTVLTLNDSQTPTNKTISGSSNTLTVLAGTQLSGQVPVANGGTGLATAPSGGVLCATASTTYAFSGALTANLPVIGGGAGACPGLGSVTGNTSKFVTNTGSNTTGQGGSWDASGNWVNNANAVFTNVPQTFSSQQIFGSTIGTQNNQSGTSYTLCLNSAQSGCAAIGSDCGKTVYFTSSSPITVTLPNNFPVPCTVQLEQGGTGQITTVAASGATGPSNPRNFTKTFAPYAVITVFVDTNSGVNAHWILTGDGA
jgi:hypothetical protein